jgi:hypothetical protein
MSYLRDPATQLIQECHRIRNNTEEPERCDLRSDYGRCPLPADVTRTYGCVHEHIVTAPLCTGHIDTLDTLTGWVCDQCYALGHACPVSLIEERPV